MKPNRLFIATIAAALATGGCDAGPEADRTGSSAAADTVSADAAPARRTAPGPDASALAPVNRSEVEGTAEIVREGDEAEVRVDVEGLKPGLRYSAHVHEGRCAEGGPIRLPLGRITADEDGSGAVRMRVAGERLPDTGLFVQLHAPTGEPVACADVSRP